MAMELKERGVCVGPMHPGCVKTGLGASGKTHQIKEAVQPGEAAEKLWKACMRKVIDWVVLPTRRNEIGLVQRSHLTLNALARWGNLYEGCGSISLELWTSCKSSTLWANRTQEVDKLDGTELSVSQLSRQRY